MFMKKYGLLKSIMMMLVMMCLCFDFSIVNAEVKTYDGIGEYIMGEFETIDVARERSKQRALQSAIESAGVFVDSYTKIVNSTVAKDEVTVIANGVLRIKEISYKYEASLDGKFIIIKAFIKAEINSDDILKWLNQSKNKQEQIIEENKRLQKENALQEKKIEELKEKLKNTQNESEKKKIAVELQREEKILLSLYKMNEAGQAMSIGDYDKCLMYAEDSLRYNPDDVLAKAVIVYAYRFKFFSDKNYINDYNRLIMDGERAEKYFPYSIWPYFIQLRGYYEKGNYEKTIRISDKIIEINPYYSGGYEIKANALKKLGRTIEAEKILEVANRVGKYHRTDDGVLGISCINRKPSAKTEKLNDVVVTEISSDKFVAESELRPGDVILEINGARIDSVYDLQLVIGLHTIGSRLDILYCRNGEKKHTKTIVSPK